MASRDVIVVGASSGGVEALTKLLAPLPPDLPAAIFIVLHVRPDGPSYLPAILNRAGGLPAAHAVDGEPIRRGRAYVAPPGLQTHLHHGRVGVKRGPQENLHRPAIDPLFRTAAHHYGSRVVGIVLSGTRDDGSAGLRIVKRGGGVVIVQDPRDAAFPDMPINALETVDADYCVAVSELPSLLVQLVTAEPGSDSPPVEVPLETRDESGRSDGISPSDNLGHPSALTCPDCSGALWEIEEEGTIRYRCRVGHGYSEDSIVTAQTNSVERALWTALRALEERKALLERLADHGRRHGHLAVAATFEQRSRQVEEDAKAIQEVIAGGRAVDPVQQ